MRPKQIIAVGFVLVLVGFVAPFLMVMGVIRSTFALSFIVYGISIVGLFMGVYGGALLIRRDTTQDR